MAETGDDICQKSNYNIFPSSSNFYIRPCMGQSLDDWSSQFSCTLCTLYTVCINVKDSLVWYGPIP